MAATALITIQTHVLQHSIKHLSTGFVVLFLKTFAWYDWKSENDRISSRWLNVIPAESWISHGYHMDITWISHGYHMDITWISHGYHMDITWISCFYLFISSESRCNVSHWIITGTGRVFPGAADAPWRAGPRRWWQKSWLVTDSVALHGCITGYDNIYIYMYINMYISAI